MNKKHMKNYFLNLMVLCMSIFFIFIVFSKNCSDSIFFNYSTKSLIKISNNWVEKINNNPTGNSISFPNTFKYSSGNKYTFNRILDDNFSSNQNTLCISTGFSDLYVYLDNDLIYTFFDDDFDKYLNKANKTILMIELPDNYMNKELKLEMNMGSYPALSYHIATPLIGNEISILYYLLLNQSFNLLIIFLLFTFTFIILATSLIATCKKIKQYDYLFFLGMFSLLSAIYSLSSTNLLELFARNNYLHNILAFIPLLLVPIPILIIVSKNTKAKYRKGLYFSIHLTFLNFIIQSLLTSLHIFDFRFMLPASHITILICIIILIYTIIRSWNDRSNSNRSFVFSIFPTIIGTFVDIIIYYNNKSHYSGLFFQIGVLIFIALQFFYVINAFWDNYSLSIKSSIYKKMAFTDALTNLNNRASFEFKIKHLTNNLDNYFSICCFSIDVNNLKDTNDNLGHRYGDSLIINSAKIIKNTFGDFGSCYRVGGDEFIILICNISDSDIQNLITEFHSKINQHNSDSELKLSLAIGYDTFNKNQDTTISSLIARCDKLMYKNKIEIKGSYR